MQTNPHYGTARHKHWREVVLRQAKYICFECAKYGRTTPAADAHHIKSVAEYPELANIISNGTMRNFRQV